jgi:hypothetical protein
MGLLSDPPDGAAGPSRAVVPARRAFWAAVNAHTPHPPVHSLNGPLPYRPVARYHQMIPLTHVR